MKLKKALVALVCAIALVTATFLGTMAYFTSQDSVTNTFTVGKVEIKLDEKNVDNDKYTVGEQDVTPERDKANEYHLLPGQEYEKDPTVTVLADSEESYIRMVMTLNKQQKLDDIFARINAAKPAGEAPLTILNVFKGYDSTNWEMVKETKSADGETRTYEFRYKETVSTRATDTASAADKALEPLFTHLVVPNEFTNEDMAAIADFKVDVVAHAIQKAGFANAEAAWAAWN